MNGLEIVYEIIYVLVYLIMSAIIIRTIALRKSWDDSYKTTFITVLIWGGLSIILSIFVNYLVFNKFSIFNQSSPLEVVLIPIILLIISLSTGSPIIKGIYKVQFKETFSFLMQVALLQFLVIFTGILPFLFLMFS